MLSVYAVNTTTTPSLTSTCMTETTPVPSPSCTGKGTYTSSIVLEAHYFFSGVTIEQLMTILLVV